ncbi:MAG: hypothetical protein ABSA12_11570 [Verrucomicrobiia bacterium]|jgi:hypothetical protein
MRARWVSERPFAPPVLAATVVASWWPGRYLRVSTVETDVQWRDKMLRLSAGTGAQPPPLCVTQVFVCRGVLASYTASVKSLRHPLYEREYADKSEAEKGHREIVELLAAGKLKF